ncbi:DNA-binding transcriptional LysR family regulator [Motilibacter rhizosphaerae]|uniref:DNA-binding transcriptional LysR family regulator n=1 Tax=Motilibacter rhizosphaerae TaxID=598652 RepID=A0A4Q7NV76_9ACTN|nr:LysR family transcriptional regulator [Motilibacter rhizosphaerae]RZS91087.1 DNA-binding transcriptional LysR family regulator [Motilibacter rhizosphaerae]
MTRGFTLVQLRYFCRVARLGSMTAAAEELAVTQSALSSAVAQLEASLGVQLFRRVPRRGLALTEAGRRLLREAPALLEDADVLVGALRDDQDAVAGELVVGIYEPLASLRVPDILREFERRHPEVHVSLVEGDQAVIREALLGGRCELALMYDMGEGGGFVQEVLETVPAHVLVAAGSRLAELGGPVSLEDVVAEPLILLDLPETRDYVLRVFHSAGLVPSVRHRLTGYETVRSFVARHHGYAVLNRKLPHGQTHSGGEVVALDIAEEVPAIDVVLATLDGVRPTRRAQAFMEICRRHHGAQDHTGRDQGERPLAGSVGLAGHVPSSPRIKELR